MGIRAIARIVVFVGILIFTGVLPVSAEPPSEAELQALNKRVIALYQGGKYAEATPLAEAYAAGAKVRYGDSSTRCRSPHQCGATA